MPKQPHPLPGSNFPTAEEIADVIARNYAGLSKHERTLLEHIGKASTARVLSTNRQQTLLACEEKVSQLSTLLGIPKASTSNKNGVTRESRYELLRAGYLLFKTLHPRMMNEQVTPRPKIVERSRGKSPKERPEIKVEEPLVLDSKCPDWPEMTITVWNGMGFSFVDLPSGKEGWDAFRVYQKAGNLKYQKTGSPRPNHFPPEDDLNELVQKT